MTSSSESPSNLKDAISGFLPSIMTIKQYSPVATVPDAAPRVDSTTNSGFWNTRRAVISLFVVVTSLVFLSLGIANGSNYEHPVLAVNTHTEESVVAEHAVQSVTSDALTPVAYSVTHSPAMTTDTPHVDTISEPTVTNTANPTTGIDTDTTKPPTTTTAEPKALGPNTSEPRMNITESIAVVSSNINNLGPAITDAPTAAPTELPMTQAPTKTPTDPPTTKAPTEAPTDAPTSGNPDEKKETIYLNLEGVPPSKIWSMNEFKRRYDYKPSTESKLGAGAFGSVFLATEMERNITVAIKAINFTEADTFEVKALLSFDHPNIIKGYGVMVDREASPDELLLVMESAAKYGNLQHSKNVALVASSPLNLQQALFNITSAIAYMHANHWAHYDSYAYNMVLADDGRTVKMIDFGLSRPFVDTSPPYDIDSLGCAFMDLSFGTSYQYANRDDALSLLSNSKCPLASMLSAMIVKPIATDTHASTLLKHDYFATVPNEACTNWRLGLSKELQVNNKHADWEFLGPPITDSPTAEPEPN